MLVRRLNSTATGHDPAKKAKSSSVCQPRSPSNLPPSGPTGPKPEYNDDCAHFYVCFFFTAELERKFQVQGCRKAAAQTTQQHLPQLIQPRQWQRQRKRGKGEAEAYKIQTRRGLRLCLTLRLSLYLSLSLSLSRSKHAHKMVAISRKVWAAILSAYLCVCVYVSVCKKLHTNAKRFLHTNVDANVQPTVAISFWPWAHNFHTQNLLTCPRGRLYGWREEHRACVCDLASLCCLFHTLFCLLIRTYITAQLKETWKPEKQQQQKQQQSIADASLLHPHFPLRSVWVLEKEVGARRVKSGWGWCLGCVLVLVTVYFMYMCVCVCLCE